MTGVTMVRASFSGKNATGNATNIPTAHRNRAVHFRLRSYRCSGFTAKPRSPRQVWPQSRGWGALRGPGPLARPGLRNLGRPTNRTH
jgi:hypothetical protein